jgi:hypothetical protein
MIAIRNPRRAAAGLRSFEAAISRLVGDRRTELGEAKQAKGPGAVVVEDA